MNAVLDIEHNTYSTSRPTNTEDILAGENLAGRRNRSKQKNQHSHVPLGWLTVWAAIFGLLHHPPFISNTLDHHIYPIKRNNMDAINSSLDDVIKKGRQEKKQHKQQHKQQQTPPAKRSQGINKRPGPIRNSSSSRGSAFRKSPIVCHIFPLTPCVAR
jgi:hypothetical protein